MSTPQIAIQSASSTCTTIARALLAHNAAISLQQARLTGSNDE
ncbi:hypothetical protein [Burkholderia ubonensis]|nr:hypothetical protein [Burkholderia ubonensis]